MRLNIVKTSPTRLRDPPRAGEMRLKGSENPCKAVALINFALLSPPNDARIHRIVVGRSMRIFDADSQFSDADNHHANVMLIFNPTIHSSIHICS
jgi:hypothetical protein